MDKVHVALGERSYDILIQANKLDNIGREVRRTVKAKRSVIITDKTVGRLYGKHVEESLSKAGLKPIVIKVPDGERSKSFSQAQRILGLMIESKIDRYTPIIALGGGVVGDLAGFVAAIFLRGAPLIQVPTTLLAQVDSSVGGKTAVNHPKGKNLIGAFYQPKMVFIDPSVLQTISHRQLVSGLAEVVKYGIIKDRSFFEFIEKNCDKLIKQDTKAICHVIKRSCQIKAKIVSADERESSGQRSLLNFGHTIGHAIETTAGYGRYTHGEAVAIGMVEAVKISRRLVGAPKKDIERVEGLLLKMGLLKKAIVGKPGQLLEVIKSDKKIKGDTINFVVMKKLGNANLYKIKPILLRRYLN